MANASSFAAFTARSLAAEPGQSPTLSRADSFAARYTTVRRRAQISLCKCGVRKLQGQPQQDNFAPPPLLSAAQPHAHAGQAHAVAVAARAVGSLAGLLRKHAHEWGPRGGDRPPLATHHPTLSARARGPAAAAVRGRGAHRGLGRAAGAARPGAPDRVRPCAASPTHGSSTICFAQAHADSLRCRHISLVALSRCRFPL